MGVDKVEMDKKKKAVMVQAGAGVHNSLINSFAGLNIQVQ